MSLLSAGNRRDFLKLTAAGTLLGSGFASRVSAAESCAPENLSQINVTHYLLRNVRLEEGFIRQQDVITATRTGLYDIEINGASVAGIHSPGFSSPLPAWDAGGHILLPATRDMHIHLDKTFYGEGWRAPLPQKCH